MRFVVRGAFLLVFSALPSGTSLAEEITLPYRGSADSNDGALQVEQRGKGSALEGNNWWGAGEGGIIGFTPQEAVGVSGFSFRGNGGVFESLKGIGVSGSSSEGEGGRFESSKGVGVSGSSSEGYAGWFASGNDHHDLVLGGAFGRLNSDPGNQNSNLVLSSNNSVFIRLDNDGGGEGNLDILNSGGEVVSSIDEKGHASVRVLKITGGNDISEQFYIGAVSKEVPLAPGTVVSIDPNVPGNLIPSAEPYDRKVAGIISGAGGVNPGVLVSSPVISRNDTVAPVALTGRVYCWADARGRPIHPGDLLTTSATPGHAMKVSDHARASGSILGKAMSPLTSGRGLVLVLVSLQ